MAQADPEFDWTTAQPVEEDNTSATLAATTFGQRSMPVPTQGPVNVDTEFDWKTATLDEPFDPTTAQPLSEQEEAGFYKELEVASRDPARILTNTEHSLLYDYRQQQDNAVARFFEGAEAIPGNLVGIAMDAGGEMKQNVTENILRPDRFAARNLATGMEVGRKVGVQLLQLFDWGQNKVADIIQRGNANDAKMREIAAAIPKTGDEKVDGDNVMAAIAKAREEGVFEETPFGPDKETDYERYLRQNSYARSHAGNITEATMGGKTMGFPEEQATVLGQKPMQSVATGGAMIFDPINAIPLGVGAFSKLRVLRRLSRVTGMPLPAIERGLAGAADRMEDFGSGVAARVTEKTGLSKNQQVATLSAVSGGSALLAANTDGMDGVLLPVAALSGVVPLYKAVGGTIRRSSQAAGTGAMVLREMRAGNIGTVRQAAADDLLRTGAVPPQFAAYMRPYASGVESTLGRVAKNPDNPEITRKLARLADNAGVTQAVRFADDAVSSGIAATLASTPFAMLAPDAEQAGAIVGGAATLGTFAGPIAGAVGRRSSRVDADIARMLIDVHAVNGGVPALISLGRDRLGQIAGMQGVVAGKTDFVTLRASDYRANVDVRESGAETAAGVFVEKASNGTARIFINVGEPASMEGKVRVRDRGDGVREIRIRGNDGRTEFIAAPKGRRLLVNDGDTVTAGQQVVDYMPPTRSMPHEIAHAILTSDILDGDIRTDMRNYITQVYGEDGIKSRGREYASQIVDGDIMFGTHEGAVALTPEEIADVRSGKRTMSDVMKGKPVEAAERDALIEARIDEYNQRSREKGGNDYDWARDEVVAEQFAGEAKGIDFRGIRAGGPKVLESALATSARVLEALGAKFDRTTGKPLDNPSVLFRDNPLFQSPVLRKRMIEHVRAYNDLLNGLEQAGKREVRGTRVSVDGTPDSAARSPHTKMRPDPDKGGQVGNEFLYVDETGKVQWRNPSEVRTREGSRTSQAKTMYNPSRILAPSSTEFGLRTTDSGRTIISGPTLPAQFDHFVHFPKWMREKARELEAGRDRGATYIADYNAIGDGKDGTYRVRNRGDIRAIQREVAFVGWEMTRNNHLKTILMDLNAFRGAAMKAINNGELGIFNNDMQVIEADLRAYLDNHKNGRPGETGIGQAKRDMLNGLIGTGTAVQRKANPLYSDLNPRGSVRSFRLDRYNDLTPTGREGLPFDYDKINSNRMPQQIPREAQGMPDAVDALTTDQLQRQYEENQGYLGLSTLGMREGRPVRGGAAQTRELLRRNEAISAELERRGVREEDPQLQRALQRRGQAMPDAAPADAPPFYMKSAQVLDSKIQGKAATADQVRAILKNPQNGIKAEELKWTGIEQAVERIAKENGGKVPKEALLRYLQEDGAVRLEEVRLGSDAKSFDPPEFAQYQLPGGENYREVVLTMPNVALERAANNLRQFESQFGSRPIPAEARPQHEALRQAVAAAKQPETYTSTHFPDTPNYVAHARLNERTDSAGKPGLFLEEIQSDRHQAGREKGYREDAQGFDDWMQSKGDPLDTIPDAPFRKDWPVQMFKRALADAVGSGKEWIGWTTGETQAARYDLSKQIKMVSAMKLMDGGYLVYMEGKDGGHLFRNQHGFSENGQRRFTPEELKEFIGKEAAENVLRGADNVAPDKDGSRDWYDSKPADLKVGGEGMKGFYDQILPKEISKYVKQWGGQVEKSRIGQPKKHSGKLTRDELAEAKRDAKALINGDINVAEFNDNWGTRLTDDDVPGSDPYRLNEAATDLVSVVRKERELDAGGTFEAWRVNITPQMRESIKKAGQALFVGGMAAVVAEQEEQ